MEKDNKKYRCMLLVAAMSLVLSLSGCQNEENITEISDQTEKTEQESELQQVQEPIEELPEHALVHLYAGLDDEHYTVGSGFIMETTEHKIYICTNRHVIQDYDVWEVYFWDGSKVTGTKVGISELYDVGVVEINKVEVPDNIREHIAPVTIQLDEWKKLDNEQPEVWTMKIDNMGLTGELVEGKLISPLAVFRWGNGYPQTELDMELAAGDSGSAIFDQNGSLVSMVYGTSHEEGKPKRWGIPLDAIVACYKEILLNNSKWNIE
ncbi:MAG: serine protease [Acetatifactor sp.]|nr:serine protease [Acetatifactor sp.]